ncbi:YodA lipocalin-like domain protein [Coriobacteriaceae bacterium BV3Ac1]|uniref:ZinT/AdcA family metal-binding protein n=1 Tax=Olegusella massiliensis TaxID=1776381 RepID=UPI0003ADACF0|nr:ZinT/AdcA family metal-binding protein [Olegusella massiliensis]ERL11804.1 YodA lipocalin-like domain protein [Coriobacteriaceae bacterium BV3Ac1]
MNRMTTLAASGISFALAATLVLTGCADNNTPTPAGSAGSSAGSASSSQSATQTVSLSDWAGSWNGFSAYLSNPELDSTFKEVGERDKKSADEVKKDFSAKVKADFDGLKIEGDTVTFLDGFEDKGGKELTHAEYHFKEARKVEHGGHQLEWDIFEASDPQAEYPVLLMMPVHGEEEMVHFHMRYGKNADELMAAADWYPTFVKPNTTLEQVKGEIKE